MKTITVNVSEPVYRDFQEYARGKDRKTSELIREAMERYHHEEISPRSQGSLSELRGLSVGKIRQSFYSGDDLLGEMTNL
jgi:hypothetical protein